MRWDEKLKLTHLSCSVDDMAVILHPIVGNSLDRRSLDRWIISVHKMILLKMKEIQHESSQESELTSINCLTREDFPATYLSEMDPQYSSMATLTDRTGAKNRNLPSLETVSGHCRQKISCGRTQTTSRRPVDWIGRFVLHNLIGSPPHVMAHLSRCRGFEWERGSFAWRKKSATDVISWY